MLPAETPALPAKPNWKITRVLGKVAQPVPFPGGKLARALARRAGTFHDTRHALILGRAELLRAMRTRRGAMVRARADLPPEQRALLQGVPSRKELAPAAEALVIHAWRTKRAA